MCFSGPLHNPKMAKIWEERVSYMTPNSKNHETMEYYSGSVIQKMNATWEQSPQVILLSDKNVELMGILVLSSFLGRLAI